MRVQRLALIVMGDRHATDDAVVRERWESVMFTRFTALEHDYDDIILIHGACGEDEEGEGTMKGIDDIADALCNFFLFPCIPVPARWRQFGKPAGPLRNRAMLNIQELLSLHGYERLVLAFHDDLEASKGTKDGVKQAWKKGVPYEVIRST